MLLLASGRGAAAVSVSGLSRSGARSCKTTATTMILLLMALVLLLFRCDLARGFCCSRPAVAQALTGHPAQHSDRSSRGCSASPLAGVEPHEQWQKLQRRVRRSPILPPYRRGISPPRGIMSSSCVLKASASPYSPSPHDQGLQQQRPSPPLDDLLPHVSGGNNDRSALGIDRRVLQQTVVPRLAGAIIKESPLDFVVVEIPQQAAS